MITLDSKDSHRVYELMSEFNWNYGGVSKWERVWARFYRAHHLFIKDRQEKMWRLDQNEAFLLFQRPDKGDYGVFLSGMDEIAQLSNKLSAALITDSIAFERELDLDNGVLTIETKAPDWRNKHPVFDDPRLNEWTFILQLPYLNNDAEPAPLTVDISARDAERLFSYLTHQAVVVQADAKICCMTPIKSPKVGIQYRPNIHAV